ncbi:MAG: helix-turn-helix transcriptional regulator [Thaumarchaeota archaeon]|nr:helix-turn-helix transcriptional regulator [Nitrososphaerota archaeon]
MSTSQQLEQGVLDECAVVHSYWNELTKVWTFPVVHSLGLKEPARFNELKRRIDGISATSLAERLTELDKLGVVQRKVFPETPPRVEYSLTPKGHELNLILLEFANWAKRWGKVPEAAPTIK